IFAYSPRRIHSLGERPLHGRILFFLEVYHAGFIEKHINTRSDFITRGFSHGGVAHRTLGDQI
ncbi:hypothetical protein JV197_18585, partial [Vibrio furnissii]